MLSRYATLAVFLLFAIGASFLAASFEAGEWYYLAATKPAWTPPAWLFAVAWAFAWLLLALVGWQVWLSGQFSRLMTLLGWVVLVDLAIAWFVLLFGLHRPGWAWLNLSLLLLVTVYCLFRFRTSSTLAFQLLIPFLLWVMFLWFWTLWVWTMNGGFLASFIL